MTLSEFPLLVLVGVLGPVISSVIMLFVTRKFERRFGGAPEQRPSAGPSPQTHRPPPPSVILRDNDLTQINGHGNTHIGRQTTNVHVRSGSGGAKTGETDEFAGMLGMWLAALALMTGFIRNLDWVFGISLAVGAGALLGVIVLTIRTRQRYAGLPFAAWVTAVMAVASTGLLAAVWYIAFNLDYRGVTLSGAHRVTLDMKSDPNWLIRWFPLGRLGEVYGTDAIALLFVGTGVLIATLLTVYVYFRTIDWVAYLRIVAVGSASARTNRQASSFAEEDWRTARPIVLAVAAFGAIAVVLALALPMRLVGDAPDPTSANVESTSTQVQETR
ncbi:hypothetical protein J2W18_002583 [Rhodococcus cercidiphylli]|nr:hypothetical protein [Rhodococcus cercidiphylli]